MPPSDVVAIDGPSGTGKSTVARLLARRLALRYLNTGAMYRAMTWAVLDLGDDPEDAAAVAALAESLTIEISTDPDDQWVLVAGHPVEHEIRSAAVTAAVSAVSAVPRVRCHAVAAQRDLIGAGGIVVEGRDIGTVVVPDAVLKVFLTASSHARAHRRATQDGRSMEELSATAEELRRRDVYDSSRSHSPLSPAADAVHVDTTALSVDEVVSHLVEMAVERGVGVAATVAGREA